MLEIALALFLHERCLFVRVYYIMYVHLLRSFLLGESSSWAPAGRAATALSWPRRRLTFIVKRHKNANIAAILKSREIIFLHFWPCGPPGMQLAN